MKTKLLPTLLLLTFLLAACGAGTPAPVTHTPVATQPPTDIPTQTPIPFPTMPPSPTAAPPYPTASVVKSNAVAFISSNNNSLDTSLWIANVDGSGERKLVDIPYSRQDGDWGIISYYLRWSPDGKWISYIEAHALWIISPNGVIKRRLFPLPDTRGSFLYRWSPDSSKIAYLEYSPDKSTVTPTPGPHMGLEPYLVGMIDIETGKVSELSSFEANAGIPILLWSPNGHDLLFIKGYSFALFEVATRKVREIKRGCGLERNFSWSPNGKWFSYTDNGVGRYFRQWICVGGLDGSNREIRVDGTSSTPVWDKTGNFLYFVTWKTNPDNIPNFKIDEWLMRYDVRTQRIESLLSVPEQQRLGLDSISPDKRTLLFESQFLEAKIDLIFVDIQSLATTKYSVDFKDLKVTFLYSYILETAWSPDNQNLILFAGDFCTPSGCGGWGPRGYGSFYTLNTKTGKASVFSGEHSIYSWQVSPIATTP